MEKLKRWAGAAVVVALVVAFLARWLSGLGNATKLSLCYEAAACKKYSQVREECSTAENFDTCLRIKMGDDAMYGDLCTGGDVGGPALGTLPQTPNRVDCFFRLLANRY